jgi:hypothetical protein
MLLDEGHQLLVYTTGKQSVLLDWGQERLPHISVYVDGKITLLKLT